MNKTVIIAVVVLILLGAGYYVMKGGYSPAPASAPATQVQTDTSAPASPNTVTISGFAFAPSTLTVKSGTTVTWVNQDSVAHTVKSAGFNSQDLQKGDTFTFTFNTKGTFPYSCGIHPTMTGTIVVE